MKDNSKKIITLLVIIIILLVGLILITWKTKIIDKDTNKDNNTQEVDKDKEKDENKEEKKEEEKKDPIITYDYYYYEEMSYYSSEVREKKLSFKKLYLLSNNTYYFVSNVIPTNEMEYSYGTYEKKDNILTLTNTKTYTSEYKCYYDDGPYTFTFDLGDLHYRDTVDGYLDIPFKKMENTEDITKVMPTNYEIACRDAINK